MDIERAIEILDPEHRERYDSIETVDEACRMGREALRQQLSAQGGDYISRELAIKALHDECVKKRLHDDEGTLDEFDTEEILRKLQSVTLKSVVRGKWIEEEAEVCRMGREALRQQLSAQGGDYVSREAVKKALEDECAYLRERGMLNAEHVLLHHGVAVIDKLPVADAKSLEKIGEEVDEALRILDNAHGRMDYGDYCDLHDAITGIAVPDSGAEAKEVQNDA